MKHANLLLLLTLGVGVDADGPEVCPAGWTQGSDGELGEAACYKFFPGKGKGEGYTHAECADVCKSDGYDAALVCIDSRAEQEYLEQTFPLEDACFPKFFERREKGHEFDTSGCAWLGLYQGSAGDDMSTSRTSVGWDHWASGCDSTYRNWQPGEPNDFGGFDENCAFKGFPLTEGRWLDIGCLTRMGCMCEGRASTTAEYLSYSETPQFKGFEGGATKAYLAALWRKLDADQSGSVDEKELENVIGESQAEEVLKRYDFDSDHVLSREEAKQAMEAYRESGEDEEDDDDGELEWYEYADDDGEGEKEGEGVPYPIFWLCMFAAVGLTVPATLLAQRKLAPTPVVTATLAAVPPATELSGAHVDVPTVVASPLPYHPPGPIAEAVPESAEGTMRSQLLPREAARV